MASSTTNIDTISSTQTSKEVTANQYFDAASPATLFGRRGSTTSALTWGYYGGRMLVDGALTTIANGTVSLSASSTNYIEATAAGVVSKNTTAFTAGSIPLYTIVVGASSVTSYTDERAWVGPSHITQQASVTINTADVTLSAEQARCGIIVLSGTLTGNRSLVVPNNWQGTVINNTSGSYTVTVKTSAGTGVTVTQGASEIVVADGTNVVLATPSTPSVLSFGTIAVSGQSDVVADAAADTLTLEAGTNVTITTDAGTDTVTISATAGATNAFGTVSVSGQSDVVADASPDTLTLAAGSGITITTDAATDTITITNSGTASNAFETIAVSGQSNIVADSGTDTLTVAAGSGITITTDAATDTLTIAASAQTQCIPIACSDETTALTAGTGKVTFRMPYAFTLSGVRASLTTAQTSGNILTVDINEGGASILSTKLTIDNTEKTSTTAATAAVISDTALADDAEITIDIDQIGDGTAKGLKVYLIGERA